MTTGLPYEQCVSCQGVRKKLSRFALIIAGLSSASACASLPDGPSPSASGGVASDATEFVRLRVAAANISAGKTTSYDPPEVQRILQSIHADVFLLQELKVDGWNGDVTAFAQEVLGSEYLADVGTGLIPNGVITHLPVIESGEWDDSYVPDRNHFWARLDLPGDGPNVLVASVHWKSASGGSNSAGLSTASVRQAQALVVNQMLSQNAEGDYLIVGGDFNTRSTGERALEELKAFEVEATNMPVDVLGVSGTSFQRTKPYDWLLADPLLSALEATIQLGEQSFSNGVVWDVRLMGDVPELAPALPEDGKVKNLQHMPVVRDFAWAYESAQ